ncbi:aminotransferase class III-fold pyridoxal phosphate-dependent enzyme, partial [Sodalis-like endosymbiont of Proechinophthirus fluctus]|uniref:aminotransferase class III-fold pyridoxal phosphate-dependent enzyme n=1 Tax=Sodalis-like endosymbiont of Proechinophthirus fluctus TaxID=1462730 RepID=UPI001FCAB2A9
SLSLLEDEIWRPRVAAITAQLSTGLMPLAEHPQVRDVRVLGAIGVVETTQPVNMAVLQRWFVDRGVWIRPFGKLIYLMPSYIISPQALAQLIDAIAGALDRSAHFLS